MSDDLETPVDPRDLRPGSLVGPWRVLERIDSGSYGVVFLVERASKPEAGPFAMKMAKQAGDPRFEREAELLRRTQHPALPRFEDFGIWISARGDDHPYLVMEYVAGSILYEWGHEEERSSRDVLEVLAQVAQGLAAVHASGAVHRDVKGDNIRVTPEGRAVLVDFGAGWFPGARPLTDTCAPPGTSVYRSPELLRFTWRFYRDDQARWKASPCDDLYALGVTAYRLVTGTYPPPISETQHEEQRELRPPRELATVTPELDSIILRLLSEDKANRGTTPQTVEALEHAALHTRHVADNPIRLLRVGVPSELEAPSRSASSSGSPPPPSRQRSSADATHHATLALLSWAAAAMVGGFVVLIGSKLPSGPAPREESAPSGPPLMAKEVPTPPIETPDAGVADAAMASVQEGPRTGLPVSAIGLAMPKTPLPGQKKPPCNPRSEVVVIGACWSILRIDPPCGAAYEREGQCYMPVFDSRPPPTSEQP
ncbi:serine/threonine protein kinase [Hyalangium minutum]|uniref:non-specific serine/threonine protein kinase n=1 Tax=Hyalangium minutum TaxID=394096 RepID=A0A085WMW7_9BACT|nr:serine/threonine-protein kinase [Hyalangium minutum]KFE69030.1 hypothetical protein DB31_6932 [Hyalangium minutum]